MPKCFANRSPAAELERQFQVQVAPPPDLVPQAAHVAAADFRARGVLAPAAYVDAFASLNGRAMQHLIDRHADLAGRADDLSNKPWMLPMPTHQSGTAAPAWSRE